MVQFLIVTGLKYSPKNILKLSNPPKNQAILVDKLSLILFVIEHYIPITMYTECYVSYFMAGKKILSQVFKSLKVVLYNV